MSQDSSNWHTSPDEVSLGELWQVVWSEKWLILAVTALFAAGSAAYALFATEWYRAEVLLAPADAELAPSLAGDLGGLAALAGVSVDRGGSGEAIATLKSRDLARELIETQELLSTLLHKRKKNGQIFESASDRDAPDIRDAVRLFHDEVLNVREDRETGLVTLAVEWTDPVTAATWATDLVRLANDNLRRRALQDAERNLAYLKGQLSHTSVVTLQQSISRLMESEMQKLMLAKGNDEFAFKTIDTAVPPNRHSRPRRAAVTAVGTMLGAFLAVLFVFLRRSVS